MKTRVKRWVDNNMGKVITDTHAEYVQCPCCATTFSAVDAPEEYRRVSSWDALKEAARTLGKHNAGKSRHITPETRAARIATLAKWRANRLVKGSNV